MAESLASETPARDATAIAEPELRSARTHGPLKRFGLDLAAVVPLLIASFYLWQALALPDAPNAVVSPRAYPIVIGVFMVVTTLVMLVLHIRDRVGARHANEESAESLSEPPSDPPVTREERNYLAAVGATILAFIVAFTTLGAVIAVFGLIAGVATLAEPTKWKRNVLAAAGFALASNYVFRVGLNVDLPTGFW